MGVKIIYPEKLTLKQQIITLNQHHIIIGCRGSALHSILFLTHVDKKQIFIIEDVDKIDVTFPMVDAIMNIKTTYIGALTKVENKNDHHANRKIDVEYVLQILKSFEIIK